MSHRGRPRRATPAAVAVLLVVLALLAGCGAGPGGPAPAVTLQVLSGSELDDLEPVLAEAQAATGVRVVLHPSGTLEGADAIAAGRAGMFDATWFSSNSYLAARPGVAARLGPSVPIASSPVVLGLRRSVAQRLGWLGRPVTWSQIAQAATAHRFTFGMTDPSSSNSGFSAVVSVATALADTGAALTAAQARSSAPGLRGFFSAQTLTSGSSGYLVDAYTRRITGADQGPPVDGLVNYESVLLEMNDSGSLPEPLEIIRPADGVVTASYPFTVLNPASDAVRDGARRLTEYLRTPAVQREIMDRTARRPATGGIALPPRFGGASPAELPFPDRADALDALLGSWYDHSRRASRTLYVLDTSGSMAPDDRIGALRRALTALAGTTRAGSGTTGRLREFRAREQVTLLPFNTTPGTPLTTEVNERDPAPDRARIAAQAAALSPGGDTAIYDSLLRADELAAGQIAGDPNRFVSIVLMTDGENTSGTDLDSYLAHLAARPPQLRGVPVFCVLFGESDPGQLDQVARRTGGRTFDARTVPLEQIFSEIRGYV